MDGSGSGGGGVDGDSSTTNRHADTSDGAMVCACVCTAATRQVLYACVMSYDIAAAVAVDVVVFLLSLRIPFSVFRFFFLCCFFFVFIFSVISTFVGSRVALSLSLFLYYFFQVRFSLRCHSRFFEFRKQGFSSRLFVLDLGTQ